VGSVRLSIQKSVFHVIDVTNTSPSNAWAIAIACPSASKVVVVVSRGSGPVTTCWNGSIELLVWTSTPPSSTAEISRPSASYTISAIGGWPATLDAVSRCASS
jgi:hypothetical protein